jgi:hypothetical protein
VSKVDVIDVMRRERLIHSLSKSGELKPLGAVGKPEPSTPRRLGFARD